MKKLLITVILATVCQFTFATSSFNHGRGHERYCGREHYYRPHCEIITPRPCVGVCLTPHRFWVQGQWVIKRGGYERWIPAHWEY
jgi:hypothetical protein